MCRRFVGLADRLDAFSFSRGSITVAAQFFYRRVIEPPGAAGGDRRRVRQWQPTLDAAVALLWWPRCAWSELNRWPGMVCNGGGRPACRMYTGTSTDGLLICHRDALTHERSTPDCLARRDVYVVVVGVYQIRVQLRRANPRGNRTAVALSMTIADGGRCSMSKRSLATVRQSRRRDSSRASSNAPLRLRSCRRQGDRITHQTNCALPGYLAFASLANDDHINARQQRHPGAPVRD